MSEKVCGCFATVVQRSVSCGATGRGNSLEAGDVDPISPSKIKIQDSIFLWPLNLCAVRPNHNVCKF